MAGGFFGYRQWFINDFIESLEEAISDKKDSDLSPDTMINLNVGLRLLEITQVYMHRIDWYLSGDDGEEAFDKGLHDDLIKLSEE